MSHHAPRPEDAFLTRRDFLHRCGMGMGALTMSSIFGQAGLMSAQGATSGSLNPLAVKNAPLPGKAKRVIHLFMNGGPAHMDTFDPKPELTRLHGKELPIHFPTERRTTTAFGSPFKFKKYGQSGIEVSELFAKTAESIDDICVIRSMHADVPNHEPSLLLMNCGEARQVRPSFGSWVTYGLGSENQNMPGFISMCPGGYPIQESQNWQAGFLPGAYQGTYIDTKHTEIEKLIENVRNRSMTTREQRQQLDVLQQLNAEHAKRRQDDAQLEARVQSYELAFRMQMDAADAFDISKEPQHIRDMYGSGTQARQILIARRLIERGVRFVQVCMAKASLGTATRKSRRTIAAWPASAIRRSARCSRISSNAGCLKKRWSFGAENLGARRPSKCRLRAAQMGTSRTAAITIITASACGSRAAA